MVVSGVGRPGEQAEGHLLNNFSGLLAGLSLLVWDLALGDQGRVVVAWSVGAGRGGDVVGWFMSEGRFPGWLVR